jgi:hypothetical protein
MALLATCSGGKFAEISNPDDFLIYARNIIRVAGPFE